MKSKRLTLSVLLVAVAVVNALACTNLIVGKNVSTDGSTIVSYSADSYGLFGELYHYPAGMHKKGTLIDIHEWDTGKYLGKIEQARQTYNVIGNINEFQLTIAETTFGGRPELVDTTGVIDYGSLIYLGLQRSRTAREAIKVMTDLVQEYGYYSSGESFTIADPNEIWIMEMIGKGPGVRGAVWVAVRIPDDCISAHANQARIHQFDMNDKNNCMYSSDVISFAREKGYFNGVNKDFSFADAYAPLDFGARRYCEARVWSYFNMFTDRGEEFLPYIEGKTDRPMPLYLKPNRKISVQDVQNAMRDHYEGTPLDISKDFGAGPYHTPYRLSPLSFKVGDKSYFNERPISTQQTGFVFVSQMRSSMPDAIGGVLWFGTDDANTSVYMPFYCSMTEVPEEVRPGNGDLYTFSPTANFWVNNWVANQAYGKYNLMIDDIRKVQGSLENKFTASRPEFEAELLKLYRAGDTPALEARVNADGASIVKEATDAYRDLALFLLVRYLDGGRKKIDENGDFARNPHGKPLSPESPGFSEDFYRLIVEKAGDRLLLK